MIRTIYEIESINNEGTETEEAYSYEEAVQIAQYFVDNGSQKVNIKEFILDGYDNKKEMHIKYSYTEGLEKGDKLTEPELSNAEIEEAIEMVNEDCFGVDLPIKVLDSKEKKEFVRLINLYKENRFTKKVKEIVLQMEELLNSSSIEDNGIINKVDGDLEITLEPLEEGLEIIYEELESNYYAYKIINHNKDVVKIKNIEARDRNEADIKANEYAEDYDEDYPDDAPHYAEFSY